MVNLYNKNIPHPDVQAITTISYSYAGKESHYANAPFEGENAFNAVQLFFHALDMRRPHFYPG